MAIHQPHDHLFKRVFGVPAEAASFLQPQLPRAHSRSLRWSMLKRDPALEQEPEGSGQDDIKMFVQYMPGSLGRDTSKHL